jgi:hypothetical protein
VLRRGREAGEKEDAAASGGRKEGDAREKRNRGEREKRLPKDLCTILENCRNLFVNQNFPLI